MVRILVRRRRSGKERQLIWDWMHSRCVEWNNERNPMATSLALMQRVRWGGEKYAGEVVVINGSSILPTFPSSRGEYVASLSTLTDSRSSASFNEFLSLLSFRGDARFEIPRFSRFKMPIDSLQIFYNFCVFLIFLVYNFPR